MENFNEEEKKPKKSVLKNLSENKSNNSKVKVLKYIVLIAVLGATYLGVFYLGNMVATKGVIMGTVPEKAIDDLSQVGDVSKYYNLFNLRNMLFSTYDGEIDDEKLLEGAMKGMADAMRFWMEKGIDGFRCDMACEVPLKFWQETIAGLRADYPEMYMLAEGEEPKLHSLSGFNSSYAWELHHMLNAIARGEKNIPELLEYIAKDAERQPADAFRLMFTSNHDENSWAGTEFERMGEAAKLMAVLTFTLPSGQPLIYTGQEMGWNHRFQFFEKDPIPAWEKNEYFDFYKELIAIRHANPALAAGSKGGKFEVVSADNGVLVFTRTLPENKVVVKVELKAPWGWEITAE